MLYISLSLYYKEINKELIKLIIKIVSAIGGDTLELKVEENITIDALKDEITRVKRIPKHIYVLAFRGSEIANTTASLKSLEMQDNDKVYLIMRTEGG